MKRILFLFCFFPLLLLAQQEIKFEDFFIDQTMRVDYFHSGNATEEDIQIDQIYQQGRWSGNPDHLLDVFNNGKYYAKVYDLATNRLIFSRGYSTYFSEYQTTDPAQKGTKRTYHESVLIPYPKSKVLFVIEVRDKRNLLHPVFIREIDPQDLHIIKESTNYGDVIIPALKNGAAHDKVDLAILAEGYSAGEQQLFKDDLEKRLTLMFSYEPYKSSRKKFNITGVFRPSPESGVDEPREGVFKKTALNASFNALDLDRYLLTEDNKALRDMAGQVAYDAIMIMVNHKRYGGGGMHNQYAIFTAHSPFTEKVFIHEFGHSFAGLGDEYYGSTVSYNEFYPRGVEPTDPNLTSLLDPDKPKWKSDVNSGKAAPTEWKKAVFDSLRQVKANREESRRFMNEHPLKGKVGFFEGAGYTSTGLYRPMLNCIMFSNDTDEFCEVCRQAIQRTIDFYAD